MSEWKPIETAPKDGTVILCWVEGALYPAIARWVITPMGRCGWCTDANYLSEDELEVYMAETSYDPTHWRHTGLPIELHDREIVNERMGKSLNRLLGIRKSLCGIYKESDPHIKLFDEALKSFKEVLNGKH